MTVDRQRERGGVGVRVREGGRSSVYVKEIVKWIFAKDFKIYHDLNDGFSNKLLSLKFNKIVSLNILKFLICQQN